MRVAFGVDGSYERRRIVGRPVLERGSFRGRISSRHAVFREQHMYYTYNERTSGDDFGTTLEDNDIPHIW